MNLATAVSAERGQRRWHQVTGCQRSSGDPRENRANRPGPGFARTMGVGASMGVHGLGSAIVRLASNACAVLYLGAVVVACGGKYEDPGSQMPGTEGPAPSASGSSGSSSGSGTGSLPMHPLGTCVPGFDRNSNPARTCPWITEKGVCFSSLDGACACICPTSGSSVCSGSFAPGPSGTTTVYCDGP